MPLFNKNKMAALSPTTPPKGFMGKNKKPVKKESKGAKAGFLATFGKK